MSFFRRSKFRFTCTVKSHKPWSFNTTEKFDTFADTLNRTRVLLNRYYLNPLTMITRKKHEIYQYQLKMGANQPYHKLNFFFSSVDDCACRISFIWSIDQTLLSVQSVGRSCWDYVLHWTDRKKIPKLYTLHSKIHVCLIDKRKPISDFSMTIFIYTNKNWRMYFIFW